jgi:hypothetical protein
MRQFVSVFPDGTALTIINKDLIKLTFTVVDIVLKNNV